MSSYRRTRVPKGNDVGRALPAVKKTCRAEPDLHLWW